MSENVQKKLKARVIHKHKTESAWRMDVYDSDGNLREDAFVPENGELIIFDPEKDGEVKRFKFGDGKTNVIDLPFTDDHLVNKFLEKPDETAAEEDWENDCDGEYLAQHILVRNPDGTKEWQSVYHRMCQDNTLPIYYNGGNIMVAADQDDIINYPETNNDWEFDAYGNNYALSIPAAKKHFVRRSLKEVANKLTVDIETEETGDIYFELTYPLDEPLDVTLGISHFDEEPIDYYYTIPANITSYVEKSSFIGNQEYNIDYVSIDSEDWSSSDMTGVAKIEVLNLGEVHAIGSITVGGKEVATQEDLEGLGGDYVPIPDPLHSPTPPDSDDPWWEEYSAYGHVVVREGNGQYYWYPLTPNNQVDTIAFRDAEGDLMLPSDQEALFTEEGKDWAGGLDYAISAATARKHFYTKEDLAYLENVFVHESSGVEVTLNNLDSMGYIGFFLSEPLEEDLTVFISYSYPLLDGDCFEGSRGITIPAGETSYEINLFGDDGSQINPDLGGYSIFDSSYYYTEDPASSPIKLLDDEHLFITKGTNVELNVNSISAQDMFVRGVEVATKDDLESLGGGGIPLPTEPADHNVPTVPLLAPGSTTEVYYEKVYQNDSIPDTIVMRTEDGDIVLPEQDSSWVDIDNNIAVSGGAVYEFVTNAIGNLEDAIAQISAELHTYAQNLTNGGEA